MYAQFLRFWCVARQAEGRLASLVVLPTHTHVAYRLKLLNPLNDAAWPLLWDDSVARWCYSSFPLAFC